MQTVNWRIFGLMMLICPVGASAIQHWLNRPIWISFAIVVPALLVNGWIAAAEHP
jgi:hypothetical protein